MARMIIPATAFAVAPRRIKAERIKAPDHLAWIRTLPCCVTGREGQSQAAHVSLVDLRFGKTGRGKSQKEGDCWTVPLVPDEHDTQHRIGEDAYWPSVKIDPCRIALALWHWSGNDEMARIIIAANREAAD